MARRPPPAPTPKLGEGNKKKGDGGSKSGNRWPRNFPLKFQQEARQGSPPGVFHWGRLKNPDGEEPGSVSSLSGAAVSAPLPQTT